MNQNSAFTYLFSAALIIGALLWGYKAIAILATGDQPELVFEIAPIFFALGLVDLASPRHEHRRLFTEIGYALFVATLGGAIVGFVWVSEAIDVLFGGPLLTLFVLGGSVARYGLWPGKWRYLPLALGLSVVPVVIIGGVLETAFGERYLEVPLLAHALGWLFLAYALLRRSPGLGPNGS